MELYYFTFAFTASSVDGLVCPWMGSIFGMVWQVLRARPSAMGRKLFFSCVELVGVQRKTM
jgi:hypothetical protein